MLPAYRESVFSATIQQNYNVDGHITQTDRTHLLESTNNTARNSLIVCDTW